MKLETQKFALSLAITFGAVYVVCSIVTALAPEIALKLLGWVAHIVNIGKFAGDVRITVGGFLIGLTQIVVYTYIVGWFFAALYNRLSK